MRPLCLEIDMATVRSVYDKLLTVVDTYATNESLDASTAYKYIGVSFCNRIEFWDDIKFYARDPNHAGHVRLVTEGKLDSILEKEDTEEGL